MSEPSETSRRRLVKAAGASLATALVAGCSTGENGGGETTTESGGEAAEDTTTTAADEAGAATTGDETPADAPTGTEAGTATTEPGLDANKTGETDDFQTPNTEPPPTADQNSDNETES